jgi:hypothetical protein
MAKRTGDVELWVVETAAKARELGGYVPGPEPMAVDAKKRRVFIWGWTLHIAETVGNRRYDHIQVAGDPPDDLLAKASSLLESGRLWHKRHVVAILEELMPKKFDRNFLYGEPLTFVNGEADIRFVDCDLTLNELAVLATALEAPFDGVRVYANPVLKAQTKTQMRHCELRVVIPGVGTDPE